MQSRWWWKSPQGSSERSTCGPKQVSSTCMYCIYLCLTWKGLYMSVFDDIRRIISVCDEMGLNERSWMIPLACYSVISVVILCVFDCFRVSLLRKILSDLLLLLLLLLLLFTQKTQAVDLVTPSLTEFVCTVMAGRSTLYCNLQF